VNQLVGTRVAALALELSAVLGRLELPPGIIAHGTTHVMALRYILAGSTAAVGAYYAPAAYKLYEAESEVTAAERSLAHLETRVKTYDGDIARAKAALKRGAAEFAAARAEAVVAVEATAQARRAQEAATRVLEDALAAEAKMTAKVAAVQAETRRDETRIVEATRRKESSAAERVRAELAVQRARGAAVKAAEAISLPPALRW
jgi:chromosome segregation ATPase